MVKTNIIGQKEKLALEYTHEGVSGRDFLKVRLWLDGFAIGTLDEEVYLPGFKASLQRVETLPEFATKALDPSRPLIPHLDAQSGGFIISLGDTFDDFSLRGFREGSDLVLVNSLRSDPFRQYAGILPGIEHRTRVELKVWQDMVQAFQTALKA